MVHKKLSIPLGGVRPTRPSSVSLTGLMRANVGSKFSSFV